MLFSKCFVASAALLGLAIAAPASQTLGSATSPSVVTVKPSSLSRPTASPSVAPFVHPRPWRHCHVLPFPFCPASPTKTSSTPSAVDVVPSRPVLVTATTPHSHSASSAVPTAKISSTPSSRPLSVAPSTLATKTTPTASPHDEVAVIKSIFEAMASVAKDSKASSTPRPQDIAKNIAEEFAAAKGSGMPLPPRKEKWCWKCIFNCAMCQ